MIEPNKLQKLWINMMKTREREIERERASARERDDRSIFLEFDMEGPFGI